LGALAALIAAGDKGATPIDHPGPRWPHYLHVLRREGLAIETVEERDGPPFPGRHARYVLRSAVEVVSIAIPENAMSADASSEIIVGEIDKSARETIRIALSAYEGTPTVSIWRWCRDALWRSASRQGRPRGRPSPPPSACRSLGVGAGDREGEWPPSP
jgi:hypothetical protein